MERALNVLGNPLVACGNDPVTGYFRDGTCRTCAEDLGGHTVCAIMTTDFLAHQRAIGNDLVTPLPEYGFPGLVPGDRWCVLAARWFQSYRAGVPAPIILASTEAHALDVVPLACLAECAADVPDDASSLV